MDTRIVGTHGTWRYVIAASAVLTLLMAVAATSVSATSPSACRVRNTITDKTYTALQPAVDAARKDDRLTVTGTCIGKTIIGTKLVIEGARTTTSGKPTLSGAGKTRVVTITKGVRVRMRSLEIVRGSSSKGRGGGGILNQGTLTLIDVVVGGNTAGSGGGGVLNTGTMKLEGASRVSHNGIGGAGTGGGVYNEGTLIMNDQSGISANRGYGAGVSNKGTLVMNDSSRISNNRAGEHYGAGVSNIGTLVMNDASSIQGNLAVVGGGVYNEGTLTMYGTSSIHDNVVRGYAGGGVFNEGEGTVTLNDASSIHANVSAGEGGGVYNDSNFPSTAGTLTVTGSSSIHHNTADYFAGGVFNAGTLTMYGTSSIHDNVAREYDGGGLYNLDEGILDGVVCAPQASANVYGNTPDDCYFE